MAKPPTEIRSLARKHTAEAIEKLAHWMRSDNPKASVAACAYLIDRGWGKAEQVIELDAQIATKVIRTPAPADNLTTWSQQFAEKPETLQ